MKMLRTITILTTLSLAAFSQQATADIKAATIDVNKLLTEYHVAKKEISILQAKRNEYAAEREERQKTLKEVVNKLTAVITKLKNKAIPEAKRKDLTEEYEDLISQYNALDKDLKESDLDQTNITKEKMAKATRRLLDEIQKIIKQHAKNNGYHWIIDTSGVSNTQVSPLVYARNAKDITNEVLAILNKNAPEKEEIASPK